MIRGADTHVTRVRTVVTRSRARSTGKYPSWKMGRMVQWESPAELNACRLLDADPAVTAFYEQPLEITYFLDGEVHRHYPDILVLAPNRSELWKIKPESEAARPETVRRTELMRRALPAYGYTYRIVLAEDLAREEAVASQLGVFRALLPKLLKDLGKIPDPRQPKKVKHKLTVVLLYGLLS